MGSGCTSAGGFNSGSLKPTPDTSVMYTGAALPALGICTGDTLAEVDAVILQKIIDYSTAVGISVPSIDLTQCDCFIKKVGCCGASSCQTLTCILEAYLDCLCELYADVQDLKTKVTAMYDGPYNTGCLTGVSSTSKLPAIMQQLITEFCALVTTVANLQTQINNLTTGLPTTIGNFMNSAIQSCQTDTVKKTGSGSTFKVTFAGGCPIGTILMWTGNVSANFTGGMGNNPGPMCGWALCDGQTHNGIVTMDMRGYFPVGVNDGTMGGGPQNAEVDNAVNPGQAYSQGAHGGEIKHQLSAAEVPAVSFSGSTAASTGTVDYYQVSRQHAQTGDNTMSYQTDGPGTSTRHGSPPNGHIPFTIPGQSFSGTTGGGGGKHENRPPYMAVYFIQRVA